MQASMYFPLQQLLLCLPFKKQTNKHINLFLRFGHKMLLYPTDFILSTCKCTQQGRSVTPGWWTKWRENRPLHRNACRNVSHAFTMDLRDMVKSLSALSLLHWKKEMQKHLNLNVVTCVLIYRKTRLDKMMDVTGLTPIEFSATQWR